MQLSTYLITACQIKKNMNEIDSELVNLRSNLSQINGSYAEIDNTLKFKWKEIKKLDTLERDLNKLRYLSELPNMFKLAISKYEAKQEGISAFKEPLRYFEDYSDVLSNYKQTFLLSKALEQNLQGSDISTEEESKLIIKHLITLGEEKSHLKNLFLKTKAQNIKKKLSLITSAKRTKEVNYEVYLKVKTDEDLSKMERISEGVFDQLQAEVEQEINQRKSAILQQNFDKNIIKQNFRLKNALDITDIKFSQVKEGTCIQVILRVSKEISSYILNSIDDYQNLFFFDKEAKRVTEAPLKDSEEKEYKKFINSLLQPYTEEIRAIMKQSDIDPDTLGEALKIIYKDFQDISKRLSNLRTLAVMDQAKRLVEESIRKQLGSQISQLEQRLFRNIDNINSQCQGQNKVNILQIQEMVQSSFNYLMNDISLTIYQFKVLLNYRNSFMKETQMLSINIFQSLQNLFELWQKINLAMVNQVHSQINNPSQQSLPNDTKGDIQIDDYKLREQELLEVAEKITVNGYSIIAYMNISMKLESFGIQEIYQIIYSMFNDDEYSGNQSSRSNYQSGYNDGWTLFETEILPMLQDMMAQLSRILRKKYCLYFSEKVNFQIRKYFKSHNWLDMVEPRDIKNEFFEICKSIYQANQCLDLLFGSTNQLQQKKTIKQSNQLQTQLKKPELLVKPKKFNAMEMEMDKFLAKKHQIYQNNDLQRYVLMTNIIHIVLKSLYENVRYQRFNIFGYQQVQTDLYFLFTTVSQVLPNEENKQFFNFYGLIVF
ncbi:UNKNOWN [Stylonychia lemnae]|uniref:Vacuolar protein sorting-associated protein 51 homolog n=1 Tax=Stylonychia lemnae TaxID=5949 RepID=A0A078AXN1_STYLE|nr:UNKNOWN [Stylonychia lemnae]|eukprot:CDW86826.1 UNKNOWN [Stylonychia lemnae]